MTGFRAPRARANDDSIPGSRWTKSWVEAVGGQRLIEPLANDLGLALDGRQRLLLNRFGDLVENLIFSGAVSAANASVDAAAQLDDLFQIVRDEVSSAVDSLSEPAKKAVAEVDVFQSDDTGLPVLHLTISQAPKLVAMVSRSYFTLRTGVSYGFKTASSSSASRLTGASAVAARRLDDKCREVGWQMSVAGVVKAWVDSVLASVEAREQRMVDGIPETLRIPSDEIVVACRNSESGGKETSEAKAGDGNAGASTKKASPGRAKGVNLDNSVMNSGDDKAGMLISGIGEQNERKCVEQEICRKELGEPSRKQAMDERKDTGLPEVPPMALRGVQTSNTILEISNEEANGVPDSDGNTEVLLMEEISDCRMEAVDARGSDACREFPRPNATEEQSIDVNLKISHERELIEIGDGDAHNEILQMELSNTSRKEMMEGQVDYVARSVSRIQSNEVCGSYKSVIFSGTEPDKTREGRESNILSQVNSCDSNLEGPFSEQIEVRVSNVDPESSGVISSDKKLDHRNPETMQVDD
jgi:hypothetical protein